MAKRQTITKSALRDLSNGTDPSSYPNQGEYKENAMRKTALISGATSGFGAAMARRFAQARWRVVATGRRAERLRALVDEFGTDTITAAPFDVCDVAAMNATLSALPEAFQGIDVLINNAGLALGTAPAPETRLDDWLRMIETNVSGLVTLTHSLLPILIERKGLIVNLSSVAGSYPYPGGNVYGATKAFVRQFSLGLRSDLHGTGVRVTSIEPGLAKTEFTLVRTGGDQAASDAVYQGAHPLTAEDIADVVCWIATMPSHVNINRLELMPVSQSWAGFQIYHDPRA
jgi:serine 3-dehydrogenase (NADP+)